MLPKKNRLKKKKDFARVYRQGELIKGNFLIVKIIDNQLDYSRFGIVVSKKVSKKATVRNKAKRRLREAIRSVITEIKGGFDIIVIALEIIQEKDFWQIKEELKKIFLRANLFR